MKKYRTRPYGKESKGQRYAMLYFDLMTSPAFKSLSNGAVRVLLMIKSRFNGYNNGDIGLSCRDCEKMGKITRNTAQKAFKELEQKGFIKLNKQGLFGTRMASTYTLTMDVNSNSRERPTNEWKEWKHGKDFSVTD